MAQVADPQDTSASNPESLGSADEMLSQLAGSEIDRLLAEADVESPQPKSQSAPVEPGATKSAHSVSDLREAAAIENELGLDEASLTSQLDELFNQLQDETAAKVAQIAEKPAAPPPAPPALAEAKAAEPSLPEPAAEAAPTEGAERAALLDAAGFEAPEKPAEAELATPAAEIQPATAQEATVAAPAAQPAATTPVSSPRAVEASAVAPPAAQDAADASERSAVLSAAGFESIDTHSEPVPAWIKPLIWINAPMRHCSPAVRHAMGRAAVVTLINSVLVLTYIAFTHRHH